MRKYFIKVQDGEIVESRFQEDGTTPDGFIEVQQFADGSTHYWDGEIREYSEAGKEAKKNGRPGYRWSALTESWIDERTPEMLANEYKQLRRAAYPSLGEQFDMLWHAMNNDPTLRIEPFYTTIKAVKDTYPKP